MRDRRCRLVQLQLSQVGVKMKKLLLASVAAVALLAGAPAHAADLGRRSTYAPPPVVVPLPVYSWTGCYIGVNAGGTWSHNDVDTAASPVFVSNLSNAQNNANAS